MIQVIEIKEYRICPFSEKGHHDCRVEIRLYNLAVPNPPKWPPPAVTSWVSEKGVFGCLRFHDIEQYPPLLLPKGQLIGVTLGPPMPGAKIYPYYITHYPVTVLDAVIDMLRNEKPVYLWVSFDDTTKEFLYAHPATGKEPTGEEENLP